MKTIFFDCDGVLSDFVGGVRNLFDLPDDWQPKQWDIPGELGLSTRQFWTEIDCAKSFWADLALYPDGIQLWSYCAELQDTHSFNLAVFTTPPITASEYWHERRLWVRQYLKFTDVFFGTQKHFCASGDKLLIDDKPENTEAWNRENGLSITWPRPWNGSKNVLATDEQIERMRQFINQFLGI